MKVLLASFVTSILVLLTSCSSRKDLNNASAKSFLMESIQRDHKQKALFPVGPFSKAVTTEWIFEDYRSMTPGGTDEKSLFRRLLDAGYVDQKSMSLSYPDIAGTYKGEAHPVPGIYMGAPKPGHAVYELTISTRPGSLFLSVQYNYHNWSATGQELLGFSGNATGTLGTDSVDLKYPWGTLPGGNFRMAKRGDLLDLTGPSPTGDMTLSGPSHGGQINVMKYSYSPSKKLQDTKTEVCDSAGGAECVSLGDYVVEDITGLLLATPVMAVGKFKWHLKPTALGTAIDPSLEHREGTGNISFGKQPDGDWQLLSYSY